MLTSAVRAGALAVLALGLVFACGARSSLEVCVDGDVLVCGSAVGACKTGKAVCREGEPGPCEGAVGPTPELCNGIDDNCDGQVDEGFHLGEPCDGPDTDLCKDDVMTCEGCTKGSDNIEVCNGVDDNCNGVVDSDCEVGDCKPSLVVTSSVPSSPDCVDEPVEAGGLGTLEFPCGGGAVTAEIGGVAFSGQVKNGVLSLDGVTTLIGPDGCFWQDSHHIEGSLSDANLTYSYSELLLDMKGLASCWSPCTESGTVEIRWPAP